MLVETYEQTEVDCDGQVECDAEAVALIEQLGLEGQQQLLRKAEGGQVERCPYRKMTADEAFVYGELLSKQTSLRRYADGPIPVRVLQVAAHAKDLFDEVEVWHAASADIKDPLLVGINKGPNYSVERFILARWGDVLLPFAELKTLACGVHRTKLIAKAKECVSKAKAALAKFEGMSNDECADEKMPSYYD